MLTSKPLCSGGLHTIHTTDSSPNRSPNHKEQSLKGINYVCLLERALKILANLILLCTCHFRKYTICCSVGLAKSLCMTLVIINRRPTRILVGLLCVFKLFMKQYSVNVRNTICNYGCYQCLSCGISWRGYLCTFWI